MPPRSRYSSTTRRQRGRQQTQNNQNDQENDQNIQENGNVEENPQGQEQQEQQLQEQYGNENVADRRAQMANIARRRAAHFATFRSANEEQDEDNVHVGGTSMRDLGPWSTAYQLASNQAAAQEARKNRLQNVTETSKEIEWEPLLPLRPLKHSLAHNAQEAFPSLQSKAMQKVAENIDLVESLVGMPQLLLTQLSTKVCALRKMTEEVFRVFVESFTMELVITNGVELSEPVLQEAVTKLSQSDLRVLHLALCGRGLSCQVINTISACPPPNLTHIDLTGAYKVTDEAMANLVYACPNLVTLIVAQCPFVAHDFLHAVAYVASRGRLPAPTRDRTQDARADVAEGSQDAAESSQDAQAMPTEDAAPKRKRQRTRGGASEGGGGRASPAPIGGGAVGSPSGEHAHGQGGRQECVDDGECMDSEQYSGPLQVLNIKECRAIGAEALCAVLKWLGGLTTLDVGGIIEVNDEVCQTIAQHCKQLQNLSLAYCKKITPAGISAIATSCSALLTIDLEEVDALDSTALHDIGTHCTRLTSLNIRRCHKVTSQALIHLLSRTQLTNLNMSGYAQHGADVVQAIAKHQAASLEVLDMSFVRGIPVEGIGLIADSCKGLRELRVHGCSQVTDNVVCGHRNSELIISGIGTIGVGPVMGGNRVEVQA